MSKKVNKIQLNVTLEGQGLVNYNGSSVPKRFVREMMSNGKINTNGSFGKENLYKSPELNSKGENIIIPKKIISSNLLRKMICGDENLINADKLALIPKLRVALFSQDNSIVRGYMITKDKSGINLKRKSALTVTDAEQISDTVTWLETKTSEGERDDTSLFYKETCGEIEYSTNMFFDIKQLQFMSTDDNYDRMALTEKDVEPFISHIDSRYGSGSAKYGNWGTTHMNLIGEQGVVLSDAVVGNIVRSTIERILDINIQRSSSYAKTSSVKIALGYEGDDIDLLSNPNFIEINNIEDFDKLMEGKTIGVNFLEIDAPTIEKIEKKPKEKK